MVGTIFLSRLDPTGFENDGVGSEQGECAETVTAAQGPMIGAHRVRSIQGVGPHGARTLCPSEKNASACCDCERFRR